MTARVVGAAVRAVLDDSAASAALVRADADGDGKGADKGVDPIAKLAAGVETLLSRADADEKNREEEKTKSDSQHKEVMDRLDGMGKRLDACESYMDAAKKDAGKKDGEGKECKDDASKKDGEKEDKEKEAKGDAKADAAAIDQRVDARVEAALRQRLPVEPTAEELPRFVAAQVAADRVFQAFGDGAAPRWLSGEGIDAYMRRLVGNYRKHSPAWKDIDLVICNGPVLDTAAKQIYADAMVAVNSPSRASPGVLREVVETDRAGRRISRFYGDPEACWGPCKAKVVRGVDRFALNLNSRH
jgi:hypothetical protein